MVSDPLFSILLPTHSRIDVIGHAVQSVLNQTVKDFELLVVGDGCPSETAAVLQGFNDPRIRFFDLPKAPYFGYANRNIALKQSRGKFIAFMADDDLVLPDHLEVLENALNGGSALAYSQAVWISTDGIAAPFLTNLEFADECEVFMLHQNSIPASCFAYRADALSRRDAWPEDVSSAADWRLWHEIIQKNPDNPLVYCPVPTVLHFSARWKQSRNSGMPQLANFLEIADNADWWPETLKPTIPASMSEQSVFASKLLEEPVVWPAKLRRATTDTVNRIAWDRIKVLGDDARKIEKLSEDLRVLTESNSALAESNRVLSEQLNAQRAENATGLVALAKSRQDTMEYKEEIDQLRNSTCWRLTKPLRNVVEFLRQ
ncbi:glycosyltransferase family 2 protein [Ochrobactrum sp. BTU1]|uniref:glycosyltransferase family 2 protein n=1 Tax=Ochrobactrum sp. BTU1 TaxID=2840456 RepID=UPI001C049FF6|nr:glycosyltransferase [Ochrobactrum sp. BTU1]